MGFYIYYLYVTCYMYCSATSELYAKSFVGGQIYICKGGL